MSTSSEVLEGYMVDIACLRGHPRAELLERARTHSKECATMGHCVESGFGLVGEDGALSLLDASATPLVLDMVRRSQGEGLRLRVHRELRDGEMELVQAEPARNFTPMLQTQITVEDLTLAETMHIEKALEAIAGGPASHGGSRCSSRHG